MSGDSRRNHGDRAVLTADTSREIERLQVARWRQMTALEKTRAVSEISRAVQELSLAGIRQRHPEASEAECRLRLAALKLGRERAVELYPALAALLGG
jgi:hypothetical protein